MLMQTNSYQLYNQKLNGLTVFRSLLNDTLLQRLQALLCACENGEMESLVSAYGAFTSTLFERDVDFPRALLELVLNDENRFLLSAARGEACPVQISRAVQKELEFFTELASFSSKDAKASLSEEIAAFLPDWETEPLDFYAAYAERITDAPKKGYGVFTKYHAFSFGADGLQPVKHPDPQSLAQLSGYEREVGIVMRNTEALLNGGTPSNLLLYGDAGTGKSSTIKAVANELQDQGLRLIEVKKSQLFRLPNLLEQLAENPLKFIIFIDDLSFTGNDEHFSALKATLEGSVTACAKNTVIYATSNRRHLVKETMGERSGDDIHLNDTLQELMSLSARFGMTITFQKPDKDGYLSIVKHLAKDYGLEMPEEELCTKAEAFAIRQNGRSPRTAKHFVETQMAKL
ncbi:MAG: ATP-binding protein [Anaerotignum sp.]|nr:ATP-binding protein [Anaerotignum sp.]MBQ7758604.1 ATP-binding protein [Anaerotignum sp.]